MKIPEAYKEAIKFDRRYLVLIGGAGAGKSETAARKVILRALQGGRHLVIRKYATTLKQSVIELIRKILKAEKIPYEYKPSERKINVMGLGEIIFVGLDDAEKLKSIADITSAWIEEASEINLDDFRQIDLRLRCETAGYKQIIITSNPVLSAEWIRTELLNKDINDVYYKVFTYKDNPFLDKDYIKTLESISDIVYRKIYVEGEWCKNDRTIVFQGWNVYNKDVGEFDFYGLDFGFNNPTGLVGVKAENDKYIVKELLYRTHLTNNELIDFLKKEIDINKKVYCDTAEPNRIEELRRAGANAVEANKNVKDGLTYLRNIITKIYVQGANLIKELNTYSYKTDRAGNITEEIIKVNDHLIDAMRYALYTHYSNSSKKITTEKELIIARALNAF